MLFFLSLLFAYVISQCSGPVTVTSTAFTGILQGQLHYDPANKRIGIAYSWSGVSNTYEVYIYDNGDQNTAQTRYIMSTGCCEASANYAAMPAVTCTGTTSFQDPFGATVTWKFTTADSPIKTFNFGLITTNSCPVKTCTAQADMYQVVDRSGSIDASEMTQLRNFAYQIANSFQFGTNAVQMGIIVFGTTASVYFTLSASKSSTLNSISGMGASSGSTCIPCGGYYAALDRSRSSIKRSGITKLGILHTDGVTNANQGIGGSCASWTISEYKDTLRAASLTRYNYWKGCSSAAFPGVGEDWISWIWMAVGIGNGIDTNNLKAVASTDIAACIGVANACQDTIWFVAASFNDLSPYVAKLVKITCSSFPTTQCTACNGFCSCGKQCLCPACVTTDNCNPMICTVADFGCQPTPKNCDDSNKCTYDSCIGTTGNCQHIAYNPAGNGSDCNENYSPSTLGDNKCTVDTCDPANGCQHTPVNCDDGNSCTVDTCSGLTGCVHTTVQAASCNCRQGSADVDCTGVTTDPCKYAVCNPNRTYSGQWPQPQQQCEIFNKNCNDNNACTDDVCVGGTCQYNVIDCSDNDWCTYDFCSASGGCYHQPVFCDDGNACTVSTCDNSKNITYNSTVGQWNGCTFAAVDCNDNQVCTTDTCLPALGCQHAPKDCALDPVLKDVINPCFEALCDNSVTQAGNSSLIASEGCFLQQVPNSTINKCGLCCVDDGNVGAYQRCVHGGNCVGSTIPTGTSAVGGLLIAAIIIACIACIALCGLLGSKGGYDIIMKSRGALSGAQTSPLYNDDGMTGTNPFYNQAGEAQAN